MAGVRTRLMGVHQLERVRPAAVAWARSRSGPSKAPGFWSGPARCRPSAPTRRAACWLKQPTTLTIAKFGTGPGPSFRVDPNAAMRSAVSSSRSWRVVVLLQDVGDDVEIGLLAQASRLGPRHRRAIRPRRLPRLSSPHASQNRVPMRGRASPPLRSGEWQEAQLASYRCFPRVACETVYTPSQVVRTARFCARPAIPAKSARKNVKTTVFLAMLEALSATIAC